MGILELIRRDFDNMENHSPNCETSIGMFAANKDLHTSAQGTLSNFFTNFESIKIYLGYDGNVYPQFRIKTHIVNI